LISKVKIFDSAGRMVFENYFSGEIRINISTLNDGLYFVQLRNEKNSVNLKATVVH